MKIDLNYNNYENGNGFFFIKVMSLNGHSMTIIKTLVTINHEKFGGEYIIYGTTINDIGSIPQ
jgi:hypothetical protein